MGGDGGDGSDGGNASDGSIGDANAPASEGSLGSPGSLGTVGEGEAAAPSEDDTSGENIGVQGLAATADAQAAMNAMAAQYGFAETGFGTVGQATTADAANLGYGFGNIGGFGFGPSIGVNGFGVGTSTGFGTVGAAQGTDAGSLGMGFGNIGGFTGENEGFGIPGANLGFDDTGALSQATINAVNEQDAYGYMSNLNNFTAPPAPPAPPSTTPSLAELGTNVPSLSDINEAQTNFPSFNIAPTVTAPSPFGQQASFAVAPETSVQENMTGLLGMTLDEQQAAIDAKDAKEAQTQEETSPKSFEQQAINIAMQQALEAKDTIDGILGTPASPQATPTAPATASFTSFSQSPPGVVGVAPPASMTATGFSPSPPGVVGVPGTPGFTGLGVDPDNPAPPTTPVDPDNPPYSQPPPAPPQNPNAPLGPNVGLFGTPPSGVVGPPTSNFGPPTAFSVAQQASPPAPALSMQEEPSMVNVPFPDAKSVPTVTVPTTPPPAPVVAPPPQQQTQVAPVTSQQFTQSQQQALTQLGQPAQAPSLAASLGFSPGTLGTGITGFAPGSNLANIAATDGPVAAAAVATGFPVTAAKAMQSLYAIPV